MGAGLRFLTPRWFDDSFKAEGKPNPLLAESEPMLS